MVRRFFAVLLLATFLPLTWLGMQIVHEFGHVIAAWATGGRILRVVLHPLVISQTELAWNPHPLLVAWAGPLIGSVVPVAIWALVRLLKLPGVTLFGFFSGFCLVANGVYLGYGSFHGIGDAGDLVADGSPQWLLVVFGLVTVALGSLQWHALGPRFGYRDANDAEIRRAALASAALLAAVIILELALCPR